MKYAVVVLALLSLALPAHAEDWKAKTIGEREEMINNYIERNNLYCPTPPVSDEDKERYIMNHERKDLESLAHKYCVKKVVAIQKFVQLFQKTPPRKAPVAAASSPPAKEKDEAPTPKTPKSVGEAVRRAIISTAEAGEKRPFSVDRVRCPNAKGTVWEPLTPNDQVCLRFWPTLY